MLQTTLKFVPVDNIGGSSEEVEGLDAKLGRPEDSPTKYGEDSGPRVNSFTRGRGQALASSSPAIMGDEAAATAAATASAAAGAAMASAATEAATAGAAAASCTDDELVKIYERHENYIARLEGLLDTGFQCQRRNRLGQSKAGYCLRFDKWKRLLICTPKDNRYKVLVSIALGQVTDVKSTGGGFFEITGVNKETGEQKDLAVGVIKDKDKTADSILSIVGSLRTFAGLDKDPQVEAGRKIKRLRAKMKMRGGGGVGTGGKSGAGGAGGRGGADGVGYGGGDGSEDGAGGAGGADDYGGNGNGNGGGGGRGFAEGGEEGRGFVEVKEICRFGGRCRNKACGRAHMCWFGTNCSRGGECRFDHLEPTAAVPAARPTRTTTTAPTTPATVQEAPPSDTQAHKVAVQASAAAATPEPEPAGAAAAPRHTTVDALGTLGGAAPATAPTPAATTPRHATVDKLGLLGATAPAAVPAPAAHGPAKAKKPRNAAGKARNNRRR